jgi:hypothetical protein
MYAKPRLLAISVFSSFEFSLSISGSADFDHRSDLTHGFAADFNLTGRLPNVQGRKATREIIIRPLNVRRPEVPVYRVLP